MKNKYWNILRLIFGLAILTLLFQKVGISKIIEVLSTIKIIYIFPIVLTYLLGPFMGSIALKLLFDKINIKIGNWRFFKHYLISQSIGLLTPGKIGQFSLVYFLKKDNNIEIGKSTSIILINKLITLAVISIFSVVGFVLLIGKTYAFNLAIALLIMFSTIIFLLVSSKSREIIKKYILRKYAIKFRGFSKTFFKYFKSYKAALITNFVLTIISIFSGVVAIYLIFLSLGMDISIWIIYLVACMEMIIALIPITINGLGIKESFGTWIYIGIGITSPIIISRYIVGLIMKYSIGFLALIFLAKKVKTKELTYHELR
ncbi:MAG: flippase-like domain-containing protein [Nanoarchaeota archaeon]|nr:flippase-like domain-containing protein [Nanoarchaeota archaeon]